MAEEGPVHEPQPVAAPATARDGPVPGSAFALPAGLGGLIAGGHGMSPSQVLALNRAAGNTAVARALATGRIVGRQPDGAPAAAAAPGAVTAPVEGAAELSRAPFAELLTTVEGWSPREEHLQAHLASPGVDGKRLSLADQIVMRKETGVDEDGVVEIAQDLYIIAAPSADKDAVFTYLGFAGLALPSNIEAFAAASKPAAAAIATMKSFGERAAAVLPLVDAWLKGVGVPPLMGPITAEGGGNAHFEKKSWTVTVDSEFAMRGGPQAPKDLLAAVYHEARHAEQDFLIARQMARETTADSIAAEHGIPIEIARAAWRSPLPADDPQNELVERLRAPSPAPLPDPEFEAMRPRLIEKKNKKEKFTPEEDAVMDRVFQRYKRRPNEADAFLVEALAKQEQALMT